MWCQLHVGELVAKLLSHLLWNGCASSHTLEHSLSMPCPAVKYTLQHDWKTVSVGMRGEGPAAISILLQFLPPPTPPHVCQ